MGVDLLDLSFRLEQRFGLDLPAQGHALVEVAGWTPDSPCGPPLEMTVGQIYEYLLSMLDVVDRRGSPQNVPAESRTWTPREVWDELSQILVECLAVDPEEVAPEARLVADLGAQ